MNIFTKNWCDLCAGASWPTAAGVICRSLREHGVVGALLMPSTDADDLAKRASSGDELWITGYSDSDSEPSSSGCLACINAARVAGLDIRYVASGDEDAHVAEFARALAIGVAPSPAPVLDRKQDSGKRRWDLLPWAAVGLAADVLAFGVTEGKSDFGWRAIPDARRRYFAALMRHALAWWEGEALDPNSGLPHLAHAVCNALFLLSLDRERAHDQR